MTLLIGSWTIGLILAILALGVFVSFRIFAFPDITADGSLTLGAAVVGALIVKGYSPWLATAVAMLAGALAGATTGVLHTKFQINGLLAGILVSTALYSVNLHVMGRSNIPLLDARTIASDLVETVTKFSGTVETVRLLGREVRLRDAVDLAAIALLVAVLAGLLRMFLGTSLGTAMRATGDNPRMIRALGVDVGRMITFGLMMSNALVALSGAIMAQYQGSADIQMGNGMIVSGLASVILGQALVGSAGLGLAITGAVMGSLLFRLMVALALRAGLDPNDLKLITAAFVLAALVLPRFFAYWSRVRTRPRPGLSPSGGARS
jgi:putative tryptophan/tyrosine transport system permease protein